MNPVIRPMTLADVPAVMAIDAVSFPRPWSADEFRREVEANPSACALVAELEGEIVGYAVLWMFHDEAHVGTIASAPAARRRGVGERLLIALFEEAWRREAITLTLEVRVSNLAAQALYARYGFVEAGRRKRYYRDNGEDGLILTVEDFTTPARREALRARAQSLR